MIRTTSSTARASEVRADSPKAGRELGEEHRPVTQVAQNYVAGSCTNERETTCTTPRRKPSPDASRHIVLTHETPFNYTLFGAHHQQQRPHQRRRRHTSHTRAYTETDPFTGFASEQYIRARRSVHISERKDQAWGFSIFRRPKDRPFCLSCHLPHGTISYFCICFACRMKA